MNDNDDILYLVDIENPTVKRTSIQEYTIKTYDKGFIDGLRAFAYWADGQQFVGISRTTLKEVIETYRECGSYLPPQIKL